MSRPVPLKRNDVHLWFCDYADPAVDGLLPSYRRWCHEAELAREDKFHFARDRRRHLVTRALVRWVLSQYSHRDPDEWRFSTNSYGKPHVQPVNGCGLDLSFNLSHTRDMIVMAVARNRMLGVDIERSGRDRFYVDDLRSCLTDQEHEMIVKMAQPQRERTFLRYWTLKEAYIKARGEGLSIALDKFHFDIGDAGTIDAHFDGSLHEDSRRWTFWQIAMEANYLVAICAECVDVAPTKVTARMCLPLAFDRPVCIDIIGRSEPETKSPETPSPDMPPR